MGGVMPAGSCKTVIYKHPGERGVSDRPNGKENSTKTEGEGDTEKNERVQKRKRK